MSQGAPYPYYVLEIWGYEVQVHAAVLGGLTGLASVLLMLVLGALVGLWAIAVVFLGALAAGGLYALYRGVHISKAQGGEHDG